jgi:hypothetical protein
LEHPTVRKLGAFISQANPEPDVTAAAAEQGERQRSARTRVRGQT